ncbi:MAG: SAM-dependent methyltransferase [Ignavibacteria bacterium]|nr:SAM-dependent methyltransferase [Ignavibacteria bacterium]
MQKGNLYLIPNTLGNDDLAATIPTNVIEIVNKIDTYIVENIQSAAKFLKLSQIKKPLKELKFNVLNINSKDTDITGYLDDALEGKDIGLISEAGVPCIADPGAQIVKLAHEKAIRVVPLSGPSSVIMAIMASGFNGQNFAFNGYLPIDKKMRQEKLKELEKKVKYESQTQVFIEAPHRNDMLLEEMLASLKPDTRICIARELTLDSERVVSASAGELRQKNITLGKVPVIFLIGK